MECVTEEPEDHGAGRADRPVETIETVFKRREEEAARRRRAAEATRAAIADVVRGGREPGWRPKDKPGAF